MRIPRPPLRSLKDKIALLFLAITALAFGLIYFLVVPALQSNLEGQRRDDVLAVARGTSGNLQQVMGGDIRASRINELVRGLSDRSGAQVTLLGVQSSGPGSLPARFYLISDSRADSRVTLPQRLAAKAVETGRAATGDGSVGGDAVAQAALPLRYRGRPDWIVVYSRPLSDVAEAVSLIRRQVLLAGAGALFITLLGGYLVASAIARRVHRLELGAEQVAAGRFIEPLPVDSEDELGQLTRTFNRMQEQLARVDRARREFIANASHELRTPIFSLGGFVELLQDEEIDANTRDEFLEEMRQQVERLQKLAVDLLDLSRLDAGSLEVTEAPVELGEVARGVAKEFTPAVANHRADLDLRLPAGGVEALADRERVVQIMRILLDNALRHTPEGVNVTVTAKRENGTAELRVADSGPGLGTAGAALAFERFYTGNAAKGSGLGLAIAQELAGRMHGQVTVASRPGDTTFTLVLPAE